MSLLRAGLIGDHISRTRLPAALDLMCNAHGWGLDFELIDAAGLQNFEFDERVTLAQLEGWTGVTVTHPYKTEARRFAGDAMALDVAALGACNTLRFAGGLTGFNTDYTGVLSMFQAHAETQDPGQVTMIGAGGVAEAIGPALLSLGHRVWIFDLVEQRAQALARTIGATAIASEALSHQVQASTGLVNATAMGMVEYPGSAFDPSWIGGQIWAFDAVYTPPDTQFVQDARQAGLKTISGFDLFRAMAVRSFEAFTGEVVDEAQMRPLLDTLRPE